MNDDQMQNNSYVLGYDLGEETAQISFLTDKNAEPKTLSVLAGTEEFDIPAVLGKRKGANQWFFGREALKRAETGEAVLATHLLDAAWKGAEVEVDGEMYDPVALLTLFVKRSLSLLSMELPPEKLGGLMFTVRELDERTTQVLSTLIGELQLKTKRIFFQSYEESFYAYMLAQPDELRGYGSLAYDYHYGELTVYHLDFNHRTTPVVATVERHFYDALRVEDRRLPEKEPLHGQALLLLDARFNEVVRQDCEEKLITSVYLIGDGFSEGWMKKSLEFLCRTRRVFQGKNLFSKGACYAGAAKLFPELQRQDVVLLGEDMLKFNLALLVNRRGKIGLASLLDAGTGWYEAEAEQDVILTEGDEVEIRAVPLDGRETRHLFIPLPELPKRPPRMTRLKIRMEMTSASRLHARVEDMGFGAMYPSGDGVWERDFALEKARGEAPRAEAEKGAESAAVEESRDAAAWEGKDAAAREERAAAVREGEDTAAREVERGESAAEESRRTECRLLLCVGRYAQAPYRFQKLERKIYSVEELCCVIEQDAFLIDVSYFDEELADWLEQECGLLKLSARLRELLKRQATAEEIGRLILEYTAYHTEAEIQAACDILRAGAEMDAYERRLARADYLMEAGKYTRAFSEYEALLQIVPKRDTGMRARVLYNEGVVLAKLFFFSEAAENFHTAWELTQNDDAYLSYLTALRLTMTEKEYVAMIGRDRQAFGFSMRLEERMREAQELYRSDEEYHKLRTLTLYREESRTAEYEAQMQAVTERLAAEYRALVADE